MDKTRLFTLHSLPLAISFTLMLPKSFGIGISIGHTSMPEEIPWAGAKRNYLGRICMLHQCPTDLSLPDNGQVPQALEASNAGEMEAFGHTAEFVWLCNQFSLESSISMTW